MISDITFLLYYPTSNQSHILGRRSGHRCPRAVGWSICQ